MGTLKGKATRFLDRHSLKMLMIAGLSEVTPLRYLQSSGRSSADIFAALAGISFAAPRACDLAQAMRAPAVQFWPRAILTRGANAAPRCIPRLIG